MVRKTSNYKLHPRQHYNSLFKGNVTEAGRNDFVPLTTCVTPERSIVYCMSEFCWWNWRCCILNKTVCRQGLLLDTLFCNRNKICMCSDVVHEEPKISCLLFSQKLLLKIA